MTKEYIEIIRQSLIPFVKKSLIEINGDGLGKSDAAEFEKDMNEVLDLAIKALEQQPCDDVMAIHTQGLAEGIRCAMCTNSMKSDSGCDGGCIIDNAMYKKVMDTINNQMFSQPTSDNCVSLGVYKQVTWERDTAIEQLKELGYSFGEKIRTSEDCVSRDAIRLKIAEMPKYTDGRKTASIRHLEDFLEKEIEEPIEVTQDMCIGFTIALECIRDFITVLPPVTPTQRWIPVITREPTEEEKKDYFEQHGEELDYMIDSPMPDNGQEVLVSVGSLVSEDIFCEDSWDFENWDIADVEAWMPLPQPYEEKRGSEDGSN